MLNRFRYTHWDVIRLPNGEITGLELSLIKINFPFMILK
jgi:hypothetical protein